MKVKDFIGYKVVYDPHGQMIWGIEGTNELQMIANVRGWGAIQHLFKTSDGNIDLQSAREFQDQLGEFIADAINEKLKRDEDQS